MPASRDFAGNKEPIILAVKVLPLAPERRPPAIAVKRESEPAGA